MIGTSEEKRKTFGFSVVMKDVTCKFINLIYPYMLDLMHSFFLSAMTKYFLTIPMIFFHLFTRFVNQPHKENPSLFHGGS